jgi:Rap1a immunity proteins
MRAVQVVLVGVMVSLVPLAGRAQEPPLSGDALLTHCQLVLQAPTARSFEAGVCVGILQTLRYIQPLLDPKYGKAGYCLPRELSDEQEVQAVVSYLQSHPERLSQEGRTLALDALHEAFPCKK